MPTVTAYLPSLISSLMVLRTSSGNVLPPISAVVGSHRPCRASPSLASALVAAGAIERTSVSTNRGLSSIGVSVEERVLSTRRVYEGWTGEQRTLSSGGARSPRLGLHRGYLASFDHGMSC